MRRYRLLVGIGEIAVVLAAFAAASGLPTIPVSLGDAAWFLAGLTLLTLSDVWLPRGDIVGMSSSLALAAILWFDARVTLAMLVLAELIALLPRGRRSVFSQALGALAAKSAAVVACSALLVPLLLHPSLGPLRLAIGRTTFKQQLSVILLGLLFATLEFSLAQLEIATRTAKPIRSSMLGGYSFGVWLVAAQASAGVLAALMWKTMGPWGVGVAVVMILIMRQSFVLLLEIRQGYNATIDVLVRAMEAQGPGREGLAARNGELSTNVGRELGMHGRELERLRYAALLVGVGLESEVDVGGSQGSDLASARIIENVEFLADVVPILKLCDSPFADVRHRSDLVSAYAVTAVAVATETLPANRLDGLRQRVSPRVTRAVDRAVVEAVAQVGVLSTLAADTPGETA